ncbi:radical SAM family heme chaperone HemW [Oscillibacter sp.]|uniref:radical SAM family heme chaperone HemW n=1 Tax=Oscillibacter sp. TaxID=1945593 RepID=UPI002D7F533B|nr:radical SAM family heme chaperone HemW [Oscillibacter sp.]
MTKPLGIYIHVPFCKQKCVYCDFYSLPCREEDMDAYVSALRAQLAETDFSGFQADTVYFGGGTPSFLAPRRLTALLEAVSAACPIAPAAEITLEANPDSAQDPGDLSALRRAGFNRVSLGMQSAGDEELKAIGRVHTMAQVRAAVDAARGAGFDNLSLDLIYGLPGQSLSRWRENLAAAVELNPEHLSCYGLKAEPGTPLYARRETLPGDDAQAEMYLETVGFLESHGYRQYEISNFAKPGRESRHNLKYWTLGEYIGFGPGAHSDFRGVRYAWARDLEAFLRGDRILSEVRRMAPQDREAEWLMLSLRLARGLDPSDWEARFRRPFAPFLPFLKRCEAAGYAVREGSRWHLTPQGFLVSNPIIGELLDQLEEE